MQVLLILDNAPSHTNLEDGLVEVLMLPPNSTAKHQPMDMGVIAAFKRRYRCKLLERMATTLVTNRQSRQEVLQNAAKQPRGTAGLSHGMLPHVLDAMELGVEAWNELTDTTITNCWWKAGILPATFDTAPTSDAEYPAVDFRLPPLTTSPGGGMTRITPFSAHRRSAETLVCHTGLL